MRQELTKELSQYYARVAKNAGMVYVLAATAVIGLTIMLIQRTQAEIYGVYGVVILILLSVLHLYRLYRITRKNYAEYSAIYLRHRLKPPQSFAEYIAARFRRGG